MNLHQLTITELLEGYRKKEFSVLEVVKSYLERIENHNPTLNAFIAPENLVALQWAKKHDEALMNEGVTTPLFGIPMGFKDIFMTKGTRTTAASKVLFDYEAQYDATVVKRLHDAGVISLGKLNCDAWAHGSSGENSDFGSTKNPWNTEYVPGGSSSGSAVAVAGDMVAASMGTDTGGSIRLPASFCNVVGLKPTYGRVSRYGVISMASSLDTIGHFTKTVEDSALLLAATAGNDVCDATTPKISVPDYMETLKKGIKGLKIGRPEEYFSEGLSNDVKEIVEKAFQELENLGAEIVDISLPHTKYANATYYIIQPAEVSSNLGRYDGIRYGKDRSSFGDEAKRRIMLGTFTLSAGYYDAYYKKALQVRTFIKKDFEDAFEKVDVIMAPVSPTLPWKLGEKVNDPLKMYLSDIFTVTANLAGIPGLSVPAGFKNNLPVGIQFLGPQFSEKLLFQVGYAYEQKTMLYKTKPNM